MPKLILIVDDDSKNLELFRDVLQVVGYTTIEATNGKQGIDLAKARQPGLILLDMQMPVMDGFEALRILKGDAATRNIPVIVLTSYAMKGDKERIFKAGCDGYIAKPVDIDELLKKVAEYFPDQGK